jgi:hypothetical protein
MSIVKVTRGTGITKRDFYSVCLYKGNRRENARYMSELFRSKGKTVEDDLVEYAAAAARILSKANLPSRPGVYTFEGTGGKCRWVAGSPSRTWTKLIAPAADAAGFACDSPEGLAARILDCLGGIARATGDRDKLVRGGMMLESLLSGFDLKTGTADGPSRGGIKGSKTRWNAHDKSNRQEALCQAFAKARRTGLPKMLAYDAAAGKSGASVRSVQRAVAMSRARG